MIGAPLGVLFKFLMKAVVMPLLGTSPVNQAYHYLAGNRAALPGAILTMIVIAGFGEETLFRGWMFERLGKWFGHGGAARVVTVLLTTVLFAVAHYPGQGLPGAEQATITGLVFGTIFAVTGGIWLPITAHAAFDLTALWMIYGNLETWAAHLMFP
jgi:membrane protease YdiL (CAAX protease family)